MTDGHFTINATGNGMKSYGRADTFMTLSAGRGNLGEEVTEIHVKIWSNDEDYGLESWFPVDRIRYALDKFYPEEPYNYED